MPVTVPNGLPKTNESTRQIITTLLRNGPLPRAELARRLSLTRASLTKLTRPMLDLGLFQQVEPASEHAMGRPGQPLSIDVSWATFAGVKLTGSHAFAVLTDLSGAAIRALDAPLPSTSVAEVEQLIVQLINDLVAGHRPPVAIGVSLAGSVLASSGRVVTSPFLGWSDVDLADELSSQLGTPVVVENDLRALTTAHHWSHATLSSFALITFGAGIGCGLVLDDRLLHGGGSAGLIDHLQVSDRGPVCTQGHRGCVSAYATTSAILRSLGADAPAADLTDVAATARVGDASAIRVLRDAGYAVGRVIGTVCNIAGPSTVILSGEGADIYDTLSAALEQGIADVIHPARPHITVSVEHLGFTEWARAAANVAMQRQLRFSTASAA